MATVQSKEKGKGKIKWIIQLIALVLFGVFLAAPGMSPKICSYPEKTPEEGAAALVVGKLPGDVQKCSTQEIHHYDKSTLGDLALLLSDYDKALKQAGYEPDQTRTPRPTSRGIGKSYRYQPFSTAMLQGAQKSPSSSIMRNIQNVFKKKRYFTVKKYYAQKGGPGGIKLIIKSRSTRAKGIYGSVGRRPRYLRVHVLKAGPHEVIQHPAKSAKAFRTLSTLLAGLPSRKMGNRRKGVNECRGSGRVLLIAVDKRGMQTSRRYESTSSSSKHNVIDALSQGFATQGISAINRLYQRMAQADYIVLFRETKAKKRGRSILGGVAYRSGNLNFRYVRGSKYVFKKWGKLLFVDPTTMEVIHQTRTMTSRKERFASRSRTFKNTYVGDRWRGKEALQSNVRKQLSACSNVSFRWFWLNKASRGNAARLRPGKPAKM